MYRSLQVCRAIAALLVVLFHLGGTFAQDKYFGFKAIDSVFAWGDAGVDFFFVLSGFLIATVHYKDFGRPEALPRYL
ncbi:MAG: acyltransferase family protein, partial [Burkholderiales bacterium]